MPTIAYICRVLKSKNDEKANNIPNGMVTRMNSSLTALSWVKRSPFMLKNCCTLGIE